MLACVLAAVAAFLQVLCSQHHQTVLVKVKILPLCQFLTHVILYYYAAIYAIYTPKPKSALPIPALPRTYLSNYSVIL